MNETIRVRRHTDGRVAIQVPADRSAWSVVRGGAQNWIHEQGVHCDGWSELLVAELPEPDGSTDAVDSNGEDTKTPYWKTSWGESVTAWIEGVETPVWELLEDLDAIRSDALKMLAAVVACEKYRAEREMTGA